MPIYHHIYRLQMIFLQLSSKIHVLSNLQGAINQKQSFIDPISPAQMHLIQFLCKHTSLNVLETIWPKFALLLRMDLFLYVKTKIKRGTQFMG